LEISLETKVETTRKLVTNAVRRQLVADVPIGCFLSGGIDSSIIAAAKKDSVAREKQENTISNRIH
jgi:asparagine synthetase B (glutamine-hydrolysing)